MTATLGIYAGETGSAAAIAVDGRVVSAMSGAGGRARDRQGRLACVEPVLQIAGLDAGDLTHVVIAEEASPQAPDSPGAEVRPLCGNREVDETLRGKPLVRVARLHADASQLRGEPRDGVILAIDDGPGGHAAIFSKRGSALRCLESIAGMPAVVRAVRTVTTAIGDTSDDPLIALDGCYGAIDASIDAAVCAAIGAHGGAAIHVDESALDRLLADARERCAAPLDAHDSVHVDVQRTRAALATSVLNRIADVLADLAVSARAGAGGELAGFSGSAFASPSLAARMTCRLDDAVFTPVPEPIGAALGAALLPHERAVPVRHLSLGPAYSDHQIKSDLENCRLDYVYEPDWNKLIVRSSDLLSSGATVAWFQGPLEFGTRSFGSRSILCDPSNQYARENVNVFLLHRPIGAPLPVSIAGSAAPADIHEWVTPRFAYASADRLPANRHGLTSALDRHGRCFVHRTDAAATPELHRLLESHHTRTGVPGLINVPLATPASLAVTPRDAVREAFGSAVDALVIGRFLVSKDYWLLRSRQPSRA